MQDEVEKFYNIRKDYYSFVIEETKFIVLNSCYIQGKDSYQYFKRNYDNTNDMFPVIPEVERQWLIQEMQDPGLNYVVFSHHSLANDFMQRGIANREENVGIGALLNGVSTKPKVSDFSLEEKIQYENIINTV